MSLRELILGAASVNPTLYVDDVFSPYLFYPLPGNSQVALKPNIDMTAGGLVWGKSTTSGNDHTLVDTARPATTFFDAFGTVPEVTNSPAITFNSNGLVAPGNHQLVSDINTTCVAWFFRKAPKFFDVITWTGDGTSNRALAHALKVTPGMVVLKSRNATGNWQVWHKDLATLTGSATSALQLDTNAAANNVGTAFGTHTSDSILVGGLNNNLGTQYVAYAYAHDPAVDSGFIQCGSYTGNGSLTTGPTITIGWEPQYILIKNVTANTNWQILDISRGIVLDGPSQVLSQLGVGSVTLAVNLTGTGFSVITNSAALNSSGAKYVYMAIRRSNKPPSRGKDVFSPAVKYQDGSSPNPVTGIGFSPDLIIGKQQNETGLSSVIARLSGVGQALSTGQANEESSTANYQSLDTDGFSIGNGFPSGNNITLEAFKRAKGFFDTVFYTGDGKNNRVIPHNLGAIPQMMWIKKRSDYGHWIVYVKPLGTAKLGILESANAFISGSDGLLGYTDPSATAFTVSNDPGPDSYRDTNSGQVKIVAHLFGNLPGICKIAAYTGNGSSQTIDCGFSTGARFVLIKRTDAAGPWTMWDTAMGIVADNDPHINLSDDSTMTYLDDTLDPTTVGFIVNQKAATNMNESGGNYIYMAIA